MRERGAFAIRALVVSVAVTLCAAGVYKVIVPKYLATEDNSTSAFTAFYELEEDSVDVLILGSSHARESVIPQELYDEYGITSYNLSSSQQSMFLSYYWLKEALQTQSPRVVVLDTLMLWENVGGPLGTTEGCVRRAMDYMRWDSVKLEAVLDICERDEDQTLASYLLPNVRYHSRWEDELETEDFLSDSIINSSELMGFAAMYDYSGNDLEYSPLVAGSSDMVSDINEVMYEYLERIVDLCAENDIELVLIKTPTTSETMARYNAMVQFAEEHGVVFYDMNEVSIYEAAGIDFNADFVDYGHANLNGALKVTAWLGELLSTEYGLEAHVNATWEDSRGTYECMVADYWLAAETDLDAYLTVLVENANRYTIFIAVQGSSLDGLSDSELDLLAALGLSAEGLGEIGTSYCAVVEAGSVLYERTSEDSLSRTGSSLDGQLLYRIASDGSEDGSCSIKLDGSQEAIQSDGLNIVVYDNARRYVVDSACFESAE